MTSCLIPFQRMKPFQRSLLLRKRIYSGAGLGKGFSKATSPVFSKNEKILNPMSVPLHRFSQALASSWLLSDSSVGPPRSHP